MKKFTLMMMVVLIGFMISCNRAEDSMDQINFSLNPGVDTVLLNTPHTDAGAHAAIGDQTFTVQVVSNTVNTGIPGVYHITYQTEYENSTYQIQRVVHVVNDPSPRINPGVDTIKVNTTWEDAGITAMGYNNNQLPFTVHGTVDTTTVGVYLIEYHVEKIPNNPTILLRYVHVVE